VAVCLLWCRTLTPFGFQAEERTLWQAPETYQLISPFNQADKIKKPLLLIHGEADNNAGVHIHILTIILLQIGCMVLRQN